MSSVAEFLGPLWDELASVLRVDDDVEFAFRFGHRLRRVDFPSLGRATRPVGRQKEDSANDRCDNAEGDAACDTLPNPSFKSRADDHEDLTQEHERNHNCSQARNEATEEP